MGGVLAEDLGLEFHGVDFAPTGLGTYFAKHSQGDALGFRIAPRWGLGHCPTGEFGKGAIGRAGLESKGERPRDEPRLPSPHGASYESPGHRIPAQGANPGDPPGKRNTRSEGTPHSLRVSDIDPALPMRCSFRTHLFSRM